HRHLSSFPTRRSSDLWVRGNVFIPDARIGWVNPSINYLKSYIETHHIDTVITTGPPHSVHLIGLGLKKILPIRWIADFRDPWTSDRKSTRLNSSHVKI